VRYDIIADYSLVQTHQNNHNRIQSLRNGISSLDEQIKQSLLSLAAARTNTIASSTTDFPDKPAFDVSYNELLSYARLISKTTLPSADILNGIDGDGAGTPTTPADTAAQTPAAATPAAGGSGTAGVGTPMPASTPAATGGAAMVNGGGATPAAQPASQELGSQPTAATTMPDYMEKTMNQHTGRPFFPWVPEDALFRGSLASNQSYIDRDINIVGYDPEEEARHEAAAKAAEEAERAAREQAEEQRRLEEYERRRAEAERARQRQAEENARRTSVAQPASSATRPERFQFLGDDDDDEED